MSYLWLQLDQNIWDHESDSWLLNQQTIEGQRATAGQLKGLVPTFDGGYKIESVTTTGGASLKYVVQKTMMRIDLPMPMEPGSTFRFSMKWWYNINNTKEIRGRTGFEPFDDGNNVYCIAQFFPRLCAYNDVEGWQNKQFLGAGEFTLIFGNYEVDITVPEDHLVAATGELINANQTLTAEQRRRVALAMKSYEQPVLIQTLEEAKENSAGRATQYRTWKFKAQNVRDFAFASSRRFIWDALGVKMSDGRTVLAQSMWIPEGHCLWSKFSTKAVAHTIRWYSHYTFDYPYPVAWSIDGNMGMEYPMVAFNYGRCESDGTYSERMKYGHIGVIIHEVGHNWFPMIVNSDERQWTWMDEGLNTFVQYLTEQQWERNYPARRGPAHLITEYMSGDPDYLEPIMTNSESVRQLGPNAYSKPATALNILRETIMGRELFDHAFKEYANRWKFKQPYPADFFRTMEDASGVDLDWFWRGWFFTTGVVDQSIASVKRFNPQSGNPRLEKNLQREAADAGLTNISTIHNRDITQTFDEIDTTIRDFYTTYDPLAADAVDDAEYRAFINNLSEEERSVLSDSLNYYQITFRNEGDLPMPIIFQIQYTDGSTEDFRLPVEVWRFGNTEFTRIVPTHKEVEHIILDPYLEIADINTDNNYYPPRESKSRFELFKSRSTFPGTGGENPMQRARRAATITSP